MTAKYIISLIDNNKYCITNGHFYRHLVNNGLTYKDYVEIYESGFTPLCECLKPLSFYNKNKSYAKSCGTPKCVGRSVSNSMKNWTESKRSEINQRKKDAISNRPDEVKELIAKKRCNTVRERYVTNYITQSNFFKNKSKETKLKRYGDPFYSNSKQSSKTKLLKSDEERYKINIKRQKTNLEKYGFVLSSPLTFYLSLRPCRTL